jgi:hypothetical protein
MDYATDDKAITLHGHRYRMGMILGVQPLRAGPIFDDKDAGTPQRFVWFPVSDPDRPKERPEPTPKLTVPAWPGLMEDNELDDEGKLHLGLNVKLANLMNVPADVDEFEVLSVPDAVYAAVDDQAFAVLGEDAGIDPLDGHKLLCREKIATAIAVLRQHDQITEHDWELAGTAMKVSDRTRGEVLAAIAADAGARNRKAGKAAGVRKVAEAEQIADEEAKRLDRIRDRCAEKLRTKNDQTENKFKKDHFQASDRDCVAKALDELEAEGVITRIPFTYHGKDAIRLHLNDGEET